MEKQAIGRYEKEKICISALNPLEDIMCWVEGLTSSKYVKDMLVSNHSLEGPMTVLERSKIVARLVEIACKFLEQAANGPKEVSFLPIYYAILNLSKAYIAVGPYGLELNENRLHGASYEANRDIGKLVDDFITLHPKGTIPLFYRTLTGENMFHSRSKPITLRMRDIYPYIYNISLEYEMATGISSRLIHFDIHVEFKGEEQRIVAKYIDTEKDDFDKVKIGTLQGFRGLRRDHDGANRLVSEWYDKGDTESLKACLRPAMLYGSIIGATKFEFQMVPWSRGKLLLPEELPLICAFFHMSSVVRYNPDGLEKLMDSKYWPMLLALRTHGLYTFLLLFWSFVTQCRTYILPI